MAGASDDGFIDIRGPRDIVMGGMTMVVFLRACWVVMGVMEAEVVASDEGVGCRSGFRKMDEFERASSSASLEIAAAERMATFEARPAGLDLPGALIDSLVGIDASTGPMERNVDSVPFSLGAEEEMVIGETRILELDWVALLESLEVFFVAVATLLVGIKRGFTMRVLQESSSPISKPLGVGSEDAAVALMRPVRFMIPDSIPVNVEDPASSRGSLSYSSASSACDFFCLSLPLGKEAAVGTTRILELNCEALMESRPLFLFVAIESSLVPLSCIRRGLTKRELDASSPITEPLAEGDGAEDAAEARMRPVIFMTPDSISVKAEEDPVSSRTLLGSSSPRESSADNALAAA